ncbi:MAG TPA: glycosyltransferase family 9 protein [bacterium]
MEKSSKVLVLAAGSLGDCVLTLPALQHLQSRSPVTVAGTQPYVDLGPGLLGVTDVVPLEPLLQKLYTPSEAQEAGLLHSMDDLFLFFKDADPKLGESLSLFKNLRVHGTSQPFEEFLKKERWAGEFWMDIAKGAITESPLIPRLQISPALREKGAFLCAQLEAPIPFIIHPGSGSLSKNAPLSFFRKAAERAKTEASRKTLVLWGEAERSWLSEIKAAFAELNGVKVLPEPLPLRYLAALFTQCSGYLGNDSGITHLASACGAKTFAVFNQTNSRVWGPQEAIILETLRTLYS